MVRRSVWTKLSQMKPYPFDDPDQIEISMPTVHFSTGKPTFHDRLLQKIDWRGTKKGAWFLFCVGFSIFVAGCFDIYNGAHTPAVMVLGLLLTGTASFRVFPRFHDFVHRKS